MATPPRIVRYRRRNPGRVRETQRKSDRKNRPNRSQTAEIKQYQREYYLRHRTERIVDAAEWKKANPKKVLANTVARQRKIKRATPPWVDMAAITEIYANCPPGHTVDHTVPINGRTVEGYRVSGLHVPWNLDYLPPNANYRKNNQMRPEDEIVATGNDNFPRQLTLLLPLRPSLKK